MIGQEVDTNLQEAEEQKKAVWAWQYENSSGLK